MKKLIIAFILVALTVTGYSQSKWDGFLKPVQHNTQIWTNDLMYRSSMMDTAIMSMWKFRPKAYITAVQLNWNKEAKGFDASALSSAGIGVGYQHFRDLGGTIYNDYGFNGLLLFGYDITQPNEAALLSLAITFSALEVVNVGCLYTFIGPENKKAFGLLMGVNVKF